MAGTKSPSSSWSFLRDSTTLRAAIAYRLRDRDLFITDVAEALGVHPDRISKYLRGVKPSLTNWQVVKLAEYLGLEVNLEVKAKEI